MKQYGLHLAWVVALVATIGSLIFGEFRHQEPCTLCWYQRIMMFPLSIVLGIAAFRRAYRIVGYVLPLSLLGLLVSLYHVLTVSLFPAALACAICRIEELTPQTLSFPLLSLGSFFLVNLFLIWTGLLNRRSRKL